MPPTVQCHDRIVEEKFELSDELTALNRVHGSTDTFGAGIDVAFGALDALKVCNTDKLTIRRIVDERAAQSESGSSEGVGEGQP